MTDKLEALCARGPWATKDGVCDAAYLRGVYERIESGRAPWSRSDRRTDCALQALRKAGLIEYAGTPRYWRIQTR